MAPSPTLDLDATHTEPANPRRDAWVASRDCSMSILDLAAFDAALLHRKPCDYVVVPGFVRSEYLVELARDYPRISGPGSFDAHRLSCGPAFSKLLEELRGPAWRDRVATKFAVDLASRPLQIGVRRFAELSDGNIHNDSRSKFVTALIYFNDDWPSESGRLRLLRNPRDIDDYAAEIEPTRGTLFCFRRSENSYHGFKPCEGERRSLQMYWVSSKRGARGGPKQTPELVRRLRRLFKRG